MPRPAQPEGAEDLLDEELLRLLAKQSRRLPLPIFLAAALMAWLASYPGWPSPLLLSWVAVLGTMLMARRSLLGRLPAMHAVPLRLRMRVAVALNAMNGLSHGAGLLFFPQEAMLPLAIASLLLVGLCAGAVATTAGNRALFLAYALPVMGALVLRWLATAQAPGPQPFALAIAFILALFGAVLLSLADDAYRLFCESFAIRLQQASLNRELRAALERAEAASRAKTRFLASASHDLRQPIHTLSLFAASLAMRPLDPVSRDISRHIDLALESLGTQLDALLDISKLDAGVVAVQPGRVELAGLIERICQQYEPIALAKGLRVSCQASQAAVTTDPVLLARVVGNLVDNAIKYTLQGDIALSVSAHGGVAVLAIEDSGVGIADDEQVRVFEEFYQVGNPERDRGKGLGLGLSIVGRTAELLGVRMEMVSRPGIGTGFYLVLALAPEEPAALAAPAHAHAHADLAGRHVLVVDDEEGIRQGMRLLLEGMGARVTLAEGEADALAAVHAGRPDFILSDLRLRGAQSGIALIAKVRAFAPDIAALLISGDTSPERLREAQAANIPLLHKPVVLDQLRHALSAIPATSPEPGPSHD
ncbi:ATP-binding response regulator [Massilia rubra]|uniref:histidine kinase n=1 Tax=Massilia rubra TaxID=2607910 RepID=A0ABX0LFK3_9BURK|nr:hybrid sensor histidine kinase/response regulator [Massilia rubra]NHZ33383.1 hybrid sensor histidine kinase/response regulator [Massilia rubra]